MVEIVEGGAELAHMTYPPVPQLGLVSAQRSPRRSEHLERRQTGGGDEGRDPVVVRAEQLPRETTSVRQRLREVRLHSWAMQVEASPLAEVEG